MTRISAADNMAVKDLSEARKWKGVSSHAIVEAAGTVAGVRDEALELSFAGVLKSVEADQRKREQDRQTYETEMGKR